MAIDPTIAANNAKQQALIEEMLEMGRQQAEIGRAQNEGAFVAGMGIREAGNAGVAAINYLGDWQKIANAKEENSFAASHGLVEPNAYFPDLGSYADNGTGDNWNAMDGAQDAMDATKDLLEDS